MNRRLSVAIGFGAIVLAAPMAIKAADLSRDVRTATDETANRPLIAQYVQSELAIIAQDADPKKTSTARDSLIDEIRGLVDPSPAFLDAYEAELLTQMPPLLANPSVRVRLNAAIVVAEVAAKSQDAQLSNLIITELNDASEAVVLWGLKAAHEVIPPALGVPNLKVQLITAVIKAAQRLASGPVISAAYRALAVGDQPPAQPAELITPVQNLLAWRIQQYATATPPEPPADARGTKFLTERNVWLTQTPRQQRTTVQLIVNLIGAAAADFSSAQPGDDRDELIDLLSEAGKAIYVIGLTTSDSALELASTPLSQITNRTAPAAVAVAVAGAIRGITTKFPGLQIPKGLSSSATPPLPTARPPH
jgi:hypothetical protein